MKRQRKMDKVALGYTAEQAGDMEAAERFYRDAIADGDAYAYNNLAQLLSESGRMREVERLYRRGVSKGDGLAAKNLVLFLLEAGKEAEAMKALKTHERMLGAKPTDTEMSEARAYSQHSDRSVRHR